MERAAFRQHAHPLGRIPGSVFTSRPEFIEPCLATERSSVPAGCDWIHEIAYDGARIQAHLIGGRPALYDSSGAECSATFASISHALQLLNASDVILDGEIVVLDERGAPDRRALLRDVEARRTDRLVYFVFDLLYLNGFDLRSAPLIRRKRALSHLLGVVPMRRIRFAEHLEAEGSAVFERARDIGITGLVSRRRDSAYRSGVQDTWVRVRCAKGRARARNPGALDPGAFMETRVIAPSRTQLAAYWARVSHRALPYLARRPLELVRDTPEPLPQVLPESVHLFRPTGFLGDAVLPVWIEDLRGLLGLLEIGAIELHPWNCSIDDPEFPRVLMFEVEGIEWRAVTRATLALRKALSADGFKSAAMLTGAGGIQVTTPLERGVTYDLAQRYSASVARRVIPKDSASSAQTFIHTEGNYRTRSTIGAYSPRARPGFPIAAPVAWRRIERGIRADAFELSHPFHAW